MDPRDISCLSQELIYFTSADPQSGKRAKEAVGQGTDGMSCCYAQRLILKPYTELLLHLNLVRDLTL